MTESEHLRRNEDAKQRLERELREDGFYTGLCIVAVILCLIAFAWMSGAL